MLKIGITGGIGSGKSVVSNLLNVMDYPVYNSDIEAKQLCDTSLPLKSELIAAFGEKIYTNDQLNRKLFADIIFNSPVQLEKANAIIHPHVALHFTDWAQKQEKALVFIESAILFESRFNQLVDKAILVYAPLEIRIMRALERDGEGQLESIQQRIKQQIPDEEKMEKVDFIIYNDEKQLIIPQLDRIITSLLND